MSVATASLNEDVAALFECRPEAIANRYATYRRLAEVGPVYRFGTQVILSRYEEVQRTQLADSMFLNGTRTNMQSLEMQEQYAKLDDAQRQKMVDFANFRGKWLVSVNGDDHARLRLLAHKSFTPRVVNGMKDRIDAITADLLDEAASQGNEVDLIGKLAWALPLIVISEMLDVPTDDLDDVRRWSADVASFSGGGSYGPELDVAYPSLFALRDYLHTIFKTRQRGQTTSLMAALLDAETDAGDKFAEDELVGMIAQLIWAGHETTTNLIGNSIYLLLNHPDQWDLLRADPDLVPSAIEETLRYLSPIQLNRRMAAEDTEISGVPVPQHATVTLLIGAANRDPARFEVPDTFDVRRDDTRHLGFGLGPRFCLGASLARMEGAAALRAILARFPRLELLSAKEDWLLNTTFCGFTRLPLLLNGRY